MWEGDLIKRLQNIVLDYDEILVVLSFAILLGFINGIVDAQIFGYHTKNLNNQIVIYWN